MTQQNKEEFPDYLSFLFNSGFELNLPSGVRVLNGGSINRVFLLEQANRKLVIKYNSKVDLPGLFEAEAQGLNFLREHSRFTIPGILFQFTGKDFSFLVLEYLDSTNQVQKDFWYEAGRKLALMHRNTEDFFGFISDNYFADIPQDNQPTADWIDFLILRRLEPLIRLNADEGRISSLTIKSVEKMYKRLDEIFPKEQPALLHGDLWSGNFLFSKNGDAALIDPAVYYGHREMDLAMTLLFGGFDSVFYSSYEEHFPLEKSWRSRVELNQLYPLLFHSWKFGGSYIPQVKEIVSVF